MVLPLPLLVRIVSSELYKFSYEKEEEKILYIFFFGESYKQTLEY